MKGSIAEIRAKQALRAKLVAGDEPEPKEEPKAEEEKPEPKPEPKKEVKGEDKVVSVPKKKKYMVADEASVGKEDGK